MHALRRAAALAVPLLAASFALTACSSGQPNAADIAAQACGNAGTGQYSSPDPSPTPGDAQGDADLLNHAAALAATAAARDPRWTQLAANLSWWATRATNRANQPNQTTTTTPSEFSQKQDELEAQCRIAHAAAEK
ncbi:hypothetical protein [Streptomyces murinus]|uniref:hypothetical protein n=1 Tax=Streptomyces murinus TaxID=33900 RepID=UPI0018F63D01|nr:hypothetical protein [Streptomyces murinus]